MQLLQPMVTLHGGLRVHRMVPELVNQDSSEHVWQQVNHLTDQERKKHP